MRAKGEGVAKSARLMCHGPRFALWLGLLLLVGCVRTVTVRPNVILPAELPVRSFPSIWVAGGARDEDAFVLDALAEHLATDPATEVRRVDMAELEPARVAHKIPTGTVVLLLDLKLDHGSETFVGSRPIQYCGLYGCTLQYASYVGTTERLTATANITVYDGPSARVQQQRAYTETVAGDDLDAMRREVLGALLVRLAQAVDMLRTQATIPLYRVRVPAVAAALEALRSGHWAEGLRALEAAARELSGYDGKTQAKVWYDLGVARWFSRGELGLDEATYAAAKRAFLWSARSAPSQSVQRALAELDAAWERQRVRDAQERARAQNFAAAKTTRTSAP